MTVWGGNQNTIKSLGRTEDGAQGFDPLTRGGAAIPLAAPPKKSGWLRPDGVRRCGTCGKPICDCSDRAWVQLPDPKDDAGRDGGKCLAPARPPVLNAPFHNPGVTDQ
jgi:hypothetical protein